MTKRLAFFLLLAPLAFGDIYRITWVGRITSASGAVDGVPIPTTLLAGRPLIGTVDYDLSVAPPLFVLDHPGGRNADYFSALSSTTNPVWMTSTVLLAVGGLALGFDPLLELSAIPPPPGATVDPGETRIQTLQIFTNPSPSVSVVSNFTDDWTSEEIRRRRSSGLNLLLNSGGLSIPSIPGPQPFFRSGGTGRLVFSDVLGDLRNPANDFDHQLALSFTVLSGGGGVDCERRAGAGDVAVVRGGVGGVGVATEAVRSGGWPLVLGLAVGVVEFVEE